MGHRTIGILGFGRRTTSPHLFCRGKKDQDTGPVLWKCKECDLEDSGLVPLEDTGQLWSCAALEDTGLPPCVLEGQRGHPTYMRFGGAERTPYVHVFLRGREDTLRTCVLEGQRGHLTYMWAKRTLCFGGCTHTMQASLFGVDSLICQSVHKPYTRAESSGREF